MYIFESLISSSRSPRTKLASKNESSPRKVDESGLSLAPEYGIYDRSSIIDEDEVGDELTLGVSTDNGIGIVSDIEADDLLSPYAPSVGSPAKTSTFGGTNAVDNSNLKATTSQYVGLTISVDDSYDNYNDDLVGDTSSEKSIQEVLGAGSEGEDDVDNENDTTLPWSRGVEELQVIIFIVLTFL